MAFSDSALAHPRPDSVRRDVTLPRRQPYYPSPVDWRGEVLYFLLVDRFSDAREASRALVDRSNPAAGRQRPDGLAWSWQDWAASGASRWQGGTIRGVTSKLDYLKRLGVTTIWLSPVFKQRGALDTYHGYGIQDFLDVDPRFGTRGDLVELVAGAHERGLRVILDIIFNHSGFNWVYPGGKERVGYSTGSYDFGAWLDADDRPATAIAGPEDGVWPTELQDPDDYTRAGTGSLGAGDIDDPFAEHKRSDFENLRDFNLNGSSVLTDLALCYKYWIALTDCDGFRIDTLKHVSLEQARNFCGTIKEFAANIGKYNFFLVGEVASGDYAQTRYLDVLAQNLNAALDIGEMRLTLTGLAQGLQHPTGYFGGFDAGQAVMGSHRNLGNRHVSILDDHDHVFGTKVRFAGNAPNDHQGAVATGLQLFTLGIPCLYYGTEQGFAGPEPGERKWLPEYGGSDRYLREAMFGPEHPRKSGCAGLPAADGAGVDTALPGFGPFGTTGRHAFSESSPTYVRIAAMNALHAAFPVLRDGRQYLRPSSFLGRPFAVYGPGELTAWARILDDDEALCVVNTHGGASRGADVVVDATLTPPGSEMEVVLNTAECASPGAYTGTHPSGSHVTVQQHAGGPAFVEIRDVGPSEVLVLSNHPRPEAGGVNLWPAARGCERQAPYHRMRGVHGGRSRGIMKEDEELTRTVTHARS